MVVHIFKLSHRIFQRFEVFLDVEYFDNIPEIYDQVKRTLQTHLKMNNFSNLLEKTKYIDFHTHDYTFFDILKQKEQKVFWVCCRDISQEPH